MEETLKRVKSDVRSVLLSAPRGVLKRNFRREFMSLVGQDLPLGKLGFTSLDDFIRSSPDVVRESIGPTGEPTLYVVANEQTQHVASLVARQKKPSLKVLRKAIPMKKFTPMRHQRNRPPPRARPIPSRNRQFAGNKMYRTSGMQKSSYSGFVPAGAEPRARPQPTQYNLYSGNSHSGFSSLFSGSSWSNPLPPPPPPPPPAATIDGGIPLWDLVYASAVEFNNVSELIKTEGRYKDKMICVTGYPGSQDQIKQYEGEFRIFLYEKYQENKLICPILNVFFGENFWNIKKHRDPFTLSSRGGDKIKVWGILTYRLWKMKGEYCHSLKALYYQRSSATGSSNGGSSQRQRSVVDGVHNMKITVHQKLPHLYGDPSSSQPLFSPLQRPSSASSSGSSPDTSIVNRTPVANGSLEDWVKHELQDKPNGLWARVIVSQYKKDYHKDPPHNLLETVCSMPFIKAEEVIPGNPILYYTVDKTPPIPKCVELTVCDSDWIDVIVVCAGSPQQFYVQCLKRECSAALQTMAEEMGRRFDKTPPENVPQSSIKRDVLYAVCWTESSEWCRTVVISDPDSHSKVCVRYPDYGNEELIPVSSLYKLPDQFYSLPLQGICCSLNDFVDTSKKACELFDKLVFEKSCAMLVTKRSHDTYVVDLVPPDSRDTSVIDLIDRALYPIESLIPHLPKFGSDRVPVRLVEVSPHEPSCVFVQIIGQATEKLEILLNDINEYYKEHSSVRDRLTKNRLELGMKCCAQYDGEWHRVEVKKITPNNSKVLLEYIDYGSEEEHEPSRLRKARIDNPLNNLPPQAIKCKLCGISSQQNSSNILERLSEYLDQELSLEMVSNTECILYDGSDHNINDLLQIKPISKMNKNASSPSQSPSPLSLSRSLSLSHQQSPSMSLSRQQSLPTVLSCQQSPPPSSPLSSPDNICTNGHSEYCIRVEDKVRYQTLPDGGSIFSVLVSNCTSPKNFTIQLESQHSNLLQLQGQLQVYCEGGPPTLSDYQEGMVGVGRFHGDQLWYRVLLKNTFQYVMKDDNEMIKEVPVQFVDYGNEGFITDIVMITKELLNCLPFQAIPAQLSGPPPECSNETFISLLVDNQFHCHLKSYDETNKRHCVALMDYKTRKLANNFT